MEIIIRQETFEDYPAVFKVIEAAFQDVAYSDQSEPYLVERLRKSAAFIPELSIVAEASGKVIGHILLTRLSITNDHASFDSLALAPVSVLPEYQGQGIGSRLIRSAHEKARELGYKSVVLIGHKDYYPRFGYKRSNEFGIRPSFDVPDENCMAIELVKNGLKGVHGTLKYDKAFFE